MIINFNISGAANSGVDKATPAASGQNLLNINGGQQAKPLNMDIVSLSNKVVSELEKMVEQYRPESIGLIKSDETAESAGIESVARVPGKYAEHLYKARAGIKDVIGTLGEMRDLIDELDRNADMYTARDRAMYQKELDGRKAKIDKISAQVNADVDPSAENPLPAFPMDSHTMGVDGVSVVNKDSMPDAINSVREGIKIAEKLEETINKMIKEMEEDYFRRKQAELAATKAEMEKKKAEAEKLGQAAVIHNAGTIEVTLNSITETGAAENSETLPQDA